MRGWEWEEAETEPAGVSEWVSEKQSLTEEAAQWLSKWKAKSVKKRWASEEAVKQSRAKKQSRSLVSWLSELRLRRQDREAETEKQIQQYREAETENGEKQWPSEEADLAQDEEQRRRRWEVCLWS